MFGIFVAEHAGACFGVERALRLVEDQLAAGKAVSTLGPLIHNTRVVSSLEQRGVRVVSKVDEVEAGSTLVLRTHGVAPKVERRCRERGLDVVDATCPYVKRVHNAARRMKAAGYDVVVAGEHGHAEVEATAAQVTGTRVVADADEARRIDAQRVALVCQTTLAASTLEAIAGALAATRETLHVQNTICSATSERQQAAADLSARVDVMIVLGGLGSANTRHLAEVSSACGTPCHHVEDASDIERSWFEGVSSAGLTAGASTPRDHITEATERLIELGGRLA